MSLLVLLSLMACKKDGPDPALDSDSPAVDSTPWGDPDDPRFATLVSATEAARVAAEVPGVAVAIFDRDGLVWARGFGDKHPDGAHGAVLPSTLFRAGSIGKSMTTVALLQLFDEGRLSLQDPVTEHVPELDFALDPSWASSVTVEHLLTHSSGFYDWGELDSGPGDENLEDLMLNTYAANFWLMAPSGSFWNYSNPNFSLAGLIVERERGQWFREVMDERVFTPLGMDRSTYLGADVQADGDFAYGYSTYGARFPHAISPTDYDSAFLRPAGLEWTSAEELAAFGRFLMVGDEAVLSDSARLAMQSFQIDMLYGSPGLGYGYGLMVSPSFDAYDSAYDTPVVFHGGDIYGYAADLYFLPELGWGVVVLASADGAHLGAPIVEALLQAPGLPEPREQVNAEPDPSLYGDLLGTWDDPWNVGPATISEDGDQLIVSFPLLDEIGYPYESTLIPYSPDNYVLGIGGTQTVLTLARDEADRPAFLRTRFAVWAPSEGVAPPMSRPVNTQALDQALQAPLGL